MGYPLPARWRRWGVVALVICGLWPAAGHAMTGGVQTVCETAARRASSMTGVPLKVLLAVSLTESGRKTGATFGAWPWTLNIAGKGAFFDSKSAALARAHATLAGGERSFDLGCFQINYRWHGEAFGALSDMLDPDLNAQYAAQFLRDLFAESGDWSVAVGHYHSRTPQYANRYRKIFHRHLANLGGGPIPVQSFPPATAVAPTVTRAPNRFPLLQPGGAPVSMGSLVPTRPNTGSLFGDRTSRSMWGG